MTQSKICLPIRRSEMIQYLNDIVRINTSSSKKDIYSLDFSFHFFLDDTDLLNDPEYYVGHFLLDRRESEIVQKVAQCLDILIVKYGGQLKNEEYLVKDEWVDVVTAAKEALASIC